MNQMKQKIKAVWMIIIIGALGVFLVVENLSKVVMGSAEPGEVD
jgi:hypothetical protein